MVQAHVAEWKKEEVSKLVEIITNNPVIGIINIHGIPAAQFQHMRRELWGDAELRISKNTLITRALREAAERHEKKGIDGLIDAIEGQTAIIGTKINPFKLYKRMAATKTKAPAKGGEEAPEDIIITAGDTPFKPGPIVGELQRVGIPAGIEKGKVVIKHDKNLVKKGETISPEVAKMLTRLEIFPLDVGLDLRAAYEEGVVLPAEVLKIDELATWESMVNAVKRAFNLAMFTGTITPYTVVPLLRKAYADALTLAINSSIYTPESINYILTKAHANMLALASIAITKGSPEALDDELRETLARTRAMEVKMEIEKEEEAEEEKEKVKEKEEGEEEAAARGLSDLFG